MNELSFKELQKQIGENAKAHGWWENRTIPEALLMIHAEVSEAVESYRRYSTDFPEELADIVIRVLDFAEEQGIDLYKEIISKHEYNKTREYRHGNKRI